MTDLPTEDDPEPIPLHQLPPFAREKGAEWSANGYTWETVEVDEETVHAKIIEDNTT